MKNEKNLKKNNNKPCVRKERISTIPLGAVRDISTRGIGPSIE